MRGLMPDGLRGFRLKPSLETPFQATQCRWYVDLIIPPLFGATVMLLSDAIAADLYTLEVVLQGLVQQRFDGLFEITLVAFHRQNIGAALTDNLYGDGFFSAHCMTTDNRVFHIHQIEQQRNRGDLVGLFRLVST
jgi:hypothetical protein